MSAVVESLARGCTMAASRPASRAATRGSETMKALSGVDATFLHLETASTPMHVASLSVFDLPPGYRRDFFVEVRRALARRLHRVPIFHRKLASMPLHFANPMWVDDDAVDLDHHVRRLTLPAPGSFEQLEDCVATLHAQPLDRGRPLWQLTVIDGLASGQVGYYLEAHHAALDGQAGVVLAKSLFDLSPRPAAVRGPMPTPAGAGAAPGALDLAAAALRHDAGQYVKLVRHLPDVVRTLAGMFAAPEPAAKRRPGSRGFAFGPHTPLNVQITAERGFAALSLPLDRLKAVARTHDATVNDVVLTLCGGALRHWLAAHGGIPKQSLTAAMPISLREAGDADYTIRATMPLVSLHTQIADPLPRLAAIHAAAGAVKAMVHRAKAVVPLDFPSIGAPWLLHGLAELYGRARIAERMPPLANVVISNIHGPDVPLYVAGARMSGYWPVSIVDHGLGLNITVMSYAGAMGFGFTTARAAVPDPHALTRALAAAFDELTAKTPGGRGRTPRAGQRADEAAGGRPTTEGRRRSLHPPDATPDSWAAAPPRWRHRGRRPGADATDGAGSGPSGVGHVHAHRDQRRFARALAGGFVEIGRRADEQGLAVGTAEHARERAGAGPDLFGDPTALAHPDHAAADRVGDPHRALGVQAAAIGGDDDLAERLGHVGGGRPRGEAGPGAAVAQRAVGGDVESAHAVAPGLAHAQRAVGGDHAAVGKPQVVGNLADGAVGIDAPQFRGPERRAPHQVEAEVAHPGAALRVHDHVVEVAAGVRRQVGVRRQGAVGLAAQQLAVAHRDDQQAAIGQPAGARRQIGRAH